MKRALLTLLLGMLPAQLTAQTPQVVLRGRGEPSLDARIRQLLDDPARRLWTADTLIARTDTVREPILVVGATVRLEGVVLGEVVLIGADVFVRPGARLLGPVLNVAGGWYASDRAVVTGEIDNRPEAPYAVERRNEGLVIRGTRQPRVVAIAPLLPGYDRVDGLSPGAGARLLLPAAGRLESSLDGWVVYRTERGQLDGGFAARLDRGRTSLGAGVERTTLTNDAWLRGTLSNSLTYLLLGDDYRDYYQARRAWVELRGDLDRGERTAELWLRGQVEDASSLRADDPWSIMGPDSIRPNRPVDDGRVTSLLAGSRLGWRRPSYEAALEGSLELALDALDSDHTFAAYRIELNWAMPALADHTLEVRAHLQGPLPVIDEDCVSCPGPKRGTPRQRWSHVGGEASLFTFSNAALQGDRVVFVESCYAIPLGVRLRLPFLGSPDLQLLHAAGTAWTRAAGRSLEHNVGLALRYNLLYLRLAANPEDLSGESRISVGLTFPRRTYDWQPPGGFF